MTMSQGAAGSIPVLVVRDSVTAWYRPISGSNSRDVAEEAYSDAIEYLKRELGGGVEARTWLDTRTSIEDIRAIVEKAKKDYAASSPNRKKVLEWLGKFSSRIMYYAQVLDVLAQHHPEYVALAWGTMKFVLVGVLNHANLVVQLSQALAKIGDVLPRTKLNAELYQTDHMREAISRLYAHIILFFQQAVKWYNMGPAGRTISAIFKPFELDYKDTVEQIRICS